MSTPAPIIRFYPYKNHSIHPPYFWKEGCPTGGMAGSHNTVVSAVTMDFSVVTMDFSVVTMDFSCVNMDFSNINMDSLL